MKTVAGWLDSRLGHRGAMRYLLDEPVPGGASFAYVFGSVLAFLLLLQFVTGALLAMTYSPSVGSAWASVAYIQDQVTLGWFIRGLHAHGASAMVIVSGLHLLQTALYGAYKKPRELNWIVGVLMLALILAFALTGYLLPWDQTGYWATKVATSIAGTTPIIGSEVKQLAQAGNEYGNLTLTRFFALHVIILPGALLLLFALHMVLFRRHGVTPHWWLDKNRASARMQRFWPHQMVRDLMAMAVAFAVLIGINVYTGGAPLGAPADPSSAFDARPEWYFRPLFQALKYFEGSMQHIVALGMPVLLGGFLLLLPFVDRGHGRSPGHRLAPLGGVAAILALLAALTVVSISEDGNNPRYAQAHERARDEARLARTLAVRHGVPPAGGPAVFTTARFYRAKRAWQQHCASCHQGDDRAGPLIAAGYNSRAWIRAYLQDPSGEEFYGPTEMRGMPAAPVSGRELDAITELVYAQSGAPDVDGGLVALGEDIFAGAGKCSGCHELDGESTEGIGPNLGGRGSIDWLRDFIALPGHPRFFGDDNEMPAYYDILDRDVRHELAQYLVYLGQLAR